MTTNVGNYWRSVKNYHGLNIAQGTDTHYVYDNRSREKKEVSPLVAIAALAVFLGIGKGFVDALTYRSHAKAVQEAQTALKNPSIANDDNSKGTIETHSQIAGAKLANGEKFLAAATVFGTACLARTAVHSKALNVAIIASLGFSCLSSAWYAWTSPRLTEMQKSLIVVRSMDDLRGPQSQS